MNGRYLEQIKERTADLMQFALMDLANRLRETYESDPDIAIEKILTRVLPEREQLVQTVDTYFQNNKYQSGMPSNDRTTPKKKLGKRDKYMEIQLSETQLCRLTTSDKAITSEYPTYIHLTNNMVFLDKSDHYLCIGIFDPTKNHVEWFKE